MATRVGIELSPSACRVIEIEGGLPWVRRAPETTVLSFDVLPPAGPETRAKLETLQKRSAAVVVWGVPSDHRQVIVTNRSYEAMRREALAALTGAGIETRGVLSDIAPAGDGKDRSPRRPVVVALAAAAPMTAALEPLRNAGIHVQSVLTPAAALTSLARTRREFSVPGSIEAYVALDKTATCIALVRDGALITARELSWGYVDDVGHTEPRRLDDITRRLAGELSEFFGAIGASSSAVSQICVCGALAELRTMTAWLTQQLDVEVEALDSLYAIDSEELLERSVEFSERSAEMRLAWAAATDWPPAINLLRARKRQSTKTALARAALVAGVVAGLGIGWQVQQSAWWRSRASVLIARVTPSTKPAPATRAPQPAVSPKPPSSTGSPRPSPAVPATKTVPQATPPAGAAKPSSPAPPPVTATKPPTAVSPSVTARNTPPPAAPAPATPPVTKPLPPAVTTMKPSPPVSPPATTTKPTAPVSPPIAATKTSPPTTPPASAAKPPPPPATTTKPTAPVSPPIAATKTPPPATPPATAAKPPPPPVATKPTAPVSPPIAATKPTAPGSPPTSAAPAARREPERAPATRTEPTPAPIVPAPTAAPPRTAPTAAAPVRPQPPVEPPPARREEPPPEPAPRRVPPARPPEVATPFDASLATILYSPDRKLAIIDGRIVGVGDEVRGARVTDITPNAVFLRDGQGKLRRLSR